MKHRILTFPDDAQLLRRTARKVKNVREAEVDVSVMKRLAHEWEDDHPGQRCEGLAATQVGIPLRIIIARKSDEMPPPPMEYLCRCIHRWKGYFTDKCPKCGECPSMGMENDEFAKWKRERASSYDPWHVLINPVYYHSEDVLEWSEACTSLPGLVCDTIRPRISTFGYYNLEGRLKRHKSMAQEAASGIIVHLFDHLDGRLATDKAIRTRRVDTPIGAVL